MAVLTIRNIDDALERRLRLRAAANGRSLEGEAREILQSALSTDEPRPRNLGRAVQERFAALGGADLPEAPREAHARARSFAEALLTMPQDDGEFPSGKVRMRDTDL
ncbi:FitA-like ribbon-helix-helix domain-containing protein [Rhodopseudomonas palustris]|uniref:FitA-like ribbon-helix-helix domain-containing protein n=1 Tax=Rhodopseudomonas palustris TaxID=1076 RepID=UPI001F37705D|nr:plasmid stabilization protein [Rhodopseudomonas palustris]